MSSVVQGNGQAAWKALRFDEFARNITKRVDPAETDATVYIGLEHLDSESFKIRRSGTPSDVIGQKLAFKAGDIIFGKRRAYQRKLGVADVDGICSAHAMVIRANKDAIEPDFLPLFMQSNVFMDRAISISVGSLSPTINWKTLRKQEFLIPPRDEQRRIATHLGAINLTINAFLSVAEDAWKLLRSLSDEYFPIAPLRYFDSPSKAVLEQRRDLKILGSVCELQSGYPFKSSEFVDAGDRLMRCSNVGVNCFNWKEADTKYWPTERREEVADYVINANDIIIAMDRPFVGEGFKIARTSEADLPALLLQRVGRFRTNDELDADYLWAFLHSVSFRWQLLRVQQGTDLPHISRFDVEGTRLRIPDIHQQQLIARRFGVAEEARSNALIHVKRLRDVADAVLRESLGR
jgi:hypothetical protein